MQPIKLEKLASLKVALVHDYLREYGGAERVLEAIHKLFPEAPVFTAYYNPQSLGIHAARFRSWNIKTSPLQKFPLANRLISPLRILAPMIFENFDLKEFDLVISSCAIYYSKAVITKPESLHISYIHTPPRYLYGYTTSFNYKKNPMTRVFGELANHFLRIYDFETSQRPDVLVANSQNVAQRIKKFYRREAEVIYPPVDTKRFKEARVVGEGGYFLSVGRLVRGKGVDVIIRACMALNKPLKVVGTGPELKYLQSISGKNIEILGQLNDQDMIAIYANARATIVASEDEDFGIVPVESMAAGTPVIAVGAGGFLETVIAGQTGEFFDQATPESLLSVLNNFDISNYSQEDCYSQAAKFSEENFNKAIFYLIEKHFKNQSKK